LSELHGCSARIACIDCGYKDLTREQLQEIIFKENPSWTAQSNTINPDADVYLTEEQLGDFKVNRESGIFERKYFGFFLATAMSAMFGSSKTRCNIFR
jgi:hypothetical protein